MTQPVVLITGISGFIAKHCAVEMLRAGYRVRGTVRSMKRTSQVQETVARHADVGALEFAQADLEADAGWKEALAGCTHVLHVASPFPAEQPKDEQVLIRPAVEGTRRVMRAAAQAGVQRFVQTSSTVAVTYGHAANRTAPFTEADWTQVDAPGVIPYAKSKTLAERAAREFARTEAKFHYASVNPGFVLGPVLDREIGTSAQILRMLLKGKYPGTPRFSFPTIDVRDVARMHRLALETNAPTGGRYICAAETMWLGDVARAIRAGLDDAARKVPSRDLPDWLVRLVAIFDPKARVAVPDLGKWMAVDNSLTRRTLGMEQFVPGSEAAVAMAKSLVDLKLL
jgi:dihydroflavonol-4-reductase